MIRIPSSLVDNDMEADFVNFLTRAEDIISFIDKNSTYYGIKNHNRWVYSYLYLREGDWSEKVSLKDCGGGDTSDVA